MNTDKAYAEKIAGEYAPREARKVAALKRLDSRARRPAYIFAYSFGTVTALLLGVGMCLSMKVIGDGGAAAMAAGVVLGVLGIIGVSLNCPLFMKILESSMKRYSADILSLAKQIAEE